MPDGATRIIAIATENARGVFALGTLAGASPRLFGVTWGGEDFSADLGAEANRDEAGAYTAPYALVRSLALLAATAAEVDAVDTCSRISAISTGSSANAARRAATASSPSWRSTRRRCRSINEAFTPSEALAAARRIVDAFAANPDLGVIGIDGEMIDRPHLKRAQRLLARAGR